MEWALERAAQKLELERGELARRALTEQVALGQQRMQMALAMAIAASQHPDVVLLDIGLPDLSGHELARRLRAEPWGTGMQLIAITGWGQEDDRRKSREAGFNEHLTKPVGPELLIGLIAPSKRHVA